MEIDPVEVGRELADDLKNAKQDFYKAYAKKLNAPHGADTTLLDQAIQRHQDVIDRIEKSAEYQAFSASSTEGATTAIAKVAAGDAGKLTVAQQADMFDQKRFLLNQDLFNARMDAATWTEHATQLPPHVAAAPNQQAWCGKCMADKAVENLSKRLAALEAARSDLLSSYADGEPRAAKVVNDARAAEEQSAATATEAAAA